MDGHRFDTLTRSLSTPGSRRNALVAVLGGTLGLLGLSHVDVASAGGKCKPACNECQTCKKGTCHKSKHGKACKKSKCQAKVEGTACTGGRCRSGICCVPNCAGKQCGDDGCGGSCGPCNGGSCPAGACTCPNGQTNCGGTCVDLATSGGNCGSCGRSCAGGCVHGACACPGNNAGLCPSGCFSCTARFDFAPPPVCSDGPGATTCDDDGDCPLGSACQFNGKCSPPC